MARQEVMTINMGPQHPSTHGVLRIILELDGETVVNAVPDIGYLHRGIEKLSEDKKYLQVIPLTDRLDYLSSGTNNLSYILAVEKLLEMDVPRRAQYIRTIFAELSRIMSHLVWLGTHAADIGALTVLLYGFREREFILDIIEETAGTRMMMTYFRPGGVVRDLPAGVDAKIIAFLDKFDVRINEYERLLTKNRIWLHRTRNIGVLSRADAISLGLSGPAMRASGVDWDIRRDEPYEAYDEIEFDIPVRTAGDIYARYLVRLVEMRQSSRMVRQLVKGLPEGPFIERTAKYVFPDKDRLKDSMEAMIHHFKLVVDGLAPPEGEVYSSIESPKGEIGFYIVSDGTPKPYRLRIRPPSFVNLQSLMDMAKGHMLADVVAIIGSLDIVLGEIDR
ncbi:MAG TPA: NADH dehydrogenase (quinone) subunit D [Proteobacteria bacterium]|nr:NADH-quinone oxidoreductase subunit D [bacterium BMS3Abin14]HDL54034.1 NADH dehydrogenase (quinone) subunit D [Pseudomonadota bacterium]